MNDPKYKVYEIFLLHIYIYICTRKVYELYEKYTKSINL